MILYSYSLYATNAFKNYYKLNFIYFFMKKISESKNIVQKSKFIGYLFEIESKEEISEVVDFVERENKKSRHICYGAIIDNEEISKNDGEVGSPGKVLLQILENEGLKSHVLIVARVFGGIKLGVGGVSRSFRACGQAVTSKN